MRILVKSVEPGLKRLLAAQDDMPLVGYLRREPDGYWVAVDHQAGLDVIRTNKGYRYAAKLTREYFGGRKFCAGGCGRVTSLGLCHHCADGSG